MVSAPFQSALGTLMVATRLTMLTLSCVLPEYVHAICESALSTSVTKLSRMMVAKLLPSAIV